MGPGITYAIVTMLAGLLLLLGWLYATSGNSHANAMLKNSLWLFALPILFAPGQFVQASLGMWAWVACEEGLKTFASSRERVGINRFWLITLFGIWELTLDKPFWGFAVSQSAGSWGGWQIALLLYATALPVLMHGITAAIYAFAFGQRLWAAFAASWLVHMCFNSAVDYFGLTLWAIVVETAVLILVLSGLLLWQKQSSTVPDFN